MKGRFLMEITNRRRGARQGKTSVFNDTKVKYNFDLSVLDLMCAYTISRNGNIKRGNLINMRNLLDAMDLSIYDNDIEKTKRLRFIRRGLEARLEHDLKIPSLILSYINGGFISGEVDVESSGLPELSNTEIQYIDETVSAALQTTFIDLELNNLFELLTQYKAQDYKYRPEMVEQIYTKINEIHNKQRQAKAHPFNSQQLSLVDGEFENGLSDIHDKLCSDSRYLYSAMQGLNMLVGGAFEATRFYLMLGMAGTGKSMTILNLALQMKKANKGYVTKDPTKIPTILFLTQENTVEETADRICKIITGYNIKSYSKQELIHILKTVGELTVTDENNINIVIMYRPDRSIDTGDLYTIIEDLEDDGYEVIALIQDHIKRIRSVSKTTDVRLELGAVVNEMKILAQLKEISVISVAHLNRDASKTIDAGAQTNKVDLTRMLGRANIGESLLMIDNSDAVLLLNPEFDRDGNKYMGMKSLKLRNGVAAIECIWHPFTSNVENSIKLVEDLYDPVPAFKTTLLPESQQAPSFSGMNGAAMTTPRYTNINKLDEEENLFTALSGTKLSDIKPTTSVTSSNINVSNGINPNSMPSFVIPIGPITIDNLDDEEDTDIVSDIVPKRIIAYY